MKISSKIFVFLSLLTLLTNIIILNYTDFIGNRQTSIYFTYYIICFFNICFKRNIFVSLALVTRKVCMIVSFGSKVTEKIWQGERVKKLPLEIQQIGRRKLRMLNNSRDVNDLRIPPSNRLEKLKGNKKEFYSIRINNQWRIIFKWENNHSLEVEILDYH